MWLIRRKGHETLQKVGTENLDGADVVIDLLKN